MDIFWIFLRLGCTSFGGPAAHLAFFQNEFVQHRKWLSAAEYAELVAICQFLPGPASSQVGFALGLQRGGWLGAVQAFIGFTLPTALLMGVLGAWAVTASIDPGILAGVLAVTVAVVAHAVLGMFRQFCASFEHRMLCFCSAAVLLVAGAPWLAILMIAGVLIWGAWKQPMPVVALSSLQQNMLLLFVVLLAAGFLAGSIGILVYLRDFYLPGALVFGGGHVALPLLQDQSPVAEPIFLAGYGAVQAMPGPLFGFTSFLGAAGDYPLPVVLSAIAATVLVFLPGFLLLSAVLPVWDQIKALPWAGATLSRVNALVVGILLAAFFSPVLEHGVVGPGTAAVCLGAWVAMDRYQVSAWKLVLGAAALGWAFL